MAIKITPEQALDKEIMIECGKRGWMCFHTNVGKIRFYDHIQGKERFFDTGLPPGWPDLLILTKNGKSIFCETKIHPRKPTKDQVAMINNLKQRGFNAFVAYTLEEFKENIKDEKI